MIGDEKRTEIEEEYGMPVERLMYYFYQECDMSKGDIADELGEPRSTVQYWLRKSGVEMRTRQLTDVQRILIMAYFDAGLGDGSIAHRVGCGQSTVNRYRKEVKYNRMPAELDSWISSEDHELLCDIIDDAFGPADDE